MSQHASAHRARFQLEHLEARCTPSALLGGPSAQAPAPPDELPAPAAGLADGTQQHAVPITLSAHITSDGPGVLRLTGVGSHLGRWTGQGVIDTIVFDPVVDRVAVSAAATLIAANGDQLFISISVSLNLTTRVGEETLTFTGGTGRFAGASGRASGVCDDVSWDPASPLTFECNSQGSGTLVFNHSR
jgi:hypothetical protein